MSAMLIKAHFALFGVALIYGANYTIAKVVLDENHVSPAGLVLLRMVAATALFFGFTFFRGKLNMRIERQDYGRFALCVVLGIFLNQILFLTGIKYTKPIEASLIMTNMPIIVFLASAIILKEKMTRAKILGICFAAIGAIAIITHKQQISLDITNLGNLLILGNAICFALFLVLVKKLLAKYPNNVLMSWAFLAGFFLMLPLAGDDLWKTQWITIPGPVYFAVAYVMVFTTFFAYNLNTFALSKLQPSSVSIYVYLQPVITTVIALVAGKDQLALIHLVGGIFIFLGVFLVSGQIFAKRTSVNPEIT